MENSNWVIDPTHSSVHFKVKHLTIATLTGTFNDISGTVEAGDQFENAKFSLSASANSISTNDEKRDTHLKSADFLEAEKYPKLTFVSTKFIQTDDDKFELTGNITIKEITKPIFLKVEYGGTATDPWRNIKAGFHLSGKINRKDFGLVWNAAIESGGFLVGDEVMLIADIELIQK